MKRFFILFFVLIWTPMSDANSAPIPTQTVIEKFIKAGMPIKASPEQKYTYCIAIGNVFHLAATNRDEGFRPEMAFDVVRGAYGERYTSATGITIKSDTIKKAINEVYFNQDFQIAGGDALDIQMYQICMGTYRPMEPLR